MYACVSAEGGLALEWSPCGTELAVATADTLSLWALEALMRPGTAGTEDAAPPSHSSAPTPLLCVDRNGLIAEEGERVAPAREPPSAAGCAIHGQAGDGDGCGSGYGSCTLSYSSDGSLIAWAVHGRKEALIVPTSPSSGDRVPSGDATAYAGALSLLTVGLSVCGVESPPRQLKPSNTASTVNPTLPPRQASQKHDT
jgi:hypothetical protein